MPLIGVPSHCARRLWPAVEPLVARALSHADGRYGPADVLERLLEGDQQLWVWSSADGRVRATCVTEIVRYPLSKRCNLFLAAGEGMSAWIGALAAIEEWARAQGCDAIDCQGRAGWERVLPGYVKTHVNLKKDLNHARR